MSRGRSSLTKSHCAARSEPGPSPRLRHPSPARAGEGKGERERASTHGWRRGLRYVAPSELNSSTNL